MKLGRRWLWLLIAVPVLAGCAMDDDYVAPPPPPGYLPSGSYMPPPPPPNTCSAAPPVYSYPQSQEPPR